MKKINEKIPLFFNKYLTIKNLGQEQIGLFF